MKTIRIVADDHVACTIALAKAFLKSGCRVQYVYITAIPKLHNLEGINISATLNYGINNLTSLLCNYIDDNSFEFIVYRYPRPLEKLKLINNVASVIIKLFHIINRKFWKEKYDIINVVGRYSSPYVDLMKYFPIQTTIYSIHEVYNHFTRQIPEHKFIKELISDRYNVVLHSQNSVNDWNYCFANYASQVSKINFGKCDSYLSCDKEKILEVTDYVLFFGFFKSYKGLNNILKMLEEYESSRRIPIVLAGAGNLPEVESLKMFKNIHIINRYISNNELASLIINSKIVICPYNTVSQSGVVQTAYAFDVPVIAPDLLAFKEVIIHRLTGLIYEAGNIKDMYDNINMVYNDPILYNDMRNNISNLDVVLPEFSWVNIVQQYNNIIDVQS